MGKSEGENVKSQLEMLGHPWDALIILDACRFDMFEKLYPRWLRGKLTKVKSAAPETAGWLMRTWKGHHDLIYFSSNPYVNSQGVPIGKFRAIDHFSKIVDVWETNWDTELGTVLPIEVNRVVMKTEIDKRAIIHYVQPHKPYVGRRGLYRGVWDEGRLRSKILKVRKRKLGRRDHPDNVSRRDAYEETLDLVLQRVSELIPYLKGKIIVSADHGELLGEGGDWGHPMRSDHPIVLEIPWFEVSGVS